MSNTEMTEFLEEGDAEMRGTLGETVSYRCAGASSACAIPAVVSPLPESYELSELGGSIVVSTASCVISKGDLATSPHPGDVVELSDGRTYVVTSVNGGGWDTSWHIVMRLTAA